MNDIKIIKVDSEIETLLKQTMASAFDLSEFNKHKKWFKYLAILPNTQYKSPALDAYYEKLLKIWVNRTDSIKNIVDQQKSTSNDDSISNENVEEPS